MGKIIKCVAQGIMWMIGILFRAALTLKWGNEEVSTFTTWSLCTEKWKTQFIDRATITSQERHEGKVQGKYILNSKT